MKQCTKCKEWKEESEFHKDKSQKSGYACSCKVCKNKQSKAFRESEEGKKYFREWQKKFRQTEKGKKYYKQYQQSEVGKQVQRRFAQSKKGKSKAIRLRQTEKYKARHRKANTRYKAANPEKIKAQSSVAYAVEIGNLPKPSTLNCIKCGNAASHYHHHKGYNKKNWLSVVPVCSKCHSAIHTSRRNQSVPE